MRAPRTIRVAGLALVALLASGCVRVVSNAGFADGPDRNASEMLLEEVERAGGTNFRMLASETRPGGSSAFGVYIGPMEFEEPGVLEDGECWSYQLVVRGNGGSASGMGSCIRAGEPVPPGGDWSWGGDEPNRLLGTVQADATEVEVRFRDGTTERFVPLRATSPFQRAFFAVVLSQPVEQVESLVAITD